MQSNGDKTLTTYSTLNRLDALITFGCRFCAITNEAQKNCEMQMQVVIHKKLG